MRKEVCCCNKPTAAAAAIQAEFGPSHRSLPAAAAAAAQNFNDDRSSPGGADRVNGPGGAARIEWPWRCGAGAARIARRSRGAAFLIGLESGKQYTDYAELYASDSTTPMLKPIARAPCMNF